MPPANARYSFLAYAPLGTYTLLAFASVKPLNLDALRSYGADSDNFPQMKVTGLSALSAGLTVAANAQPGNVYAQTTAEYTVVQKTF